MTALTPARSFPCTTTSICLTSRFEPVVFVKLSKLWMRLAFSRHESHGDRVQVVTADAFEYLPPEPVDVLVCEMLPAAMLRENKIDVTERFKQRYLAHRRVRFRLPAVLP